GFDFIDEGEGEDEGATREVEPLPSRVEEELLRRVFDDARDDLRELLAGAVAPAPTYRELWGLLGALCVGRPSDRADLLIDELVQRAGLPLGGNEERRRFMEAANICLLFQLSL